MLSHHLKKANGVIVLLTRSVYVSLNFKTKYLGSVHSTSSARGGGNSIISIAFILKVNTVHRLK